MTIVLLSLVASLDSWKSRNSFPRIEKKDRDSRLSSLVNITTLNKDISRKGVCTSRQNVNAAGHTWQGEILTLR